MNRARQSGSSYSIRQRGRQHTVAALLSTDGTLMTWGDNTQVQSGDATDLSWADVPLPPSATQITSADGTDVTAGDATDETWSA